MNVVVNGNTSNSATVLAYAQQFPITYSLPGGATVEKVVLMRPGSVTHSFDFDQRYVQLAPGDQEPAPGQVWAKTPAAAPNAAPPNNPDFSSAPRGYYMLFLVTNTGVPSVARWVRLQ